MKKIGIIGGSRLSQLKNLVITHQAQVKTPYGEPSCNLISGFLEEREVVLLPRRGKADTVPPHKINFRANIWALRDAGVDIVIATNAVAGIQTDYQVGKIVLPHQLIDYTYGRENTFFGDESGVSSIPFADPYSQFVREHIIKIANEMSIPLIDKAVYGVSQGPRLETRAEINKMAKEGCDVVGMTSMPEAALARELSLEYSTIAMVIRNVLEELPKNDHLLNHCANTIETLIEQVILKFD